VETPKVETPKVETPKVKHKPSIKKAKKQKSYSVAKKKATKKVTITSSNNNNKWIKLASERLKQTDLKILKQHQQNNTINKFAYKYSVHKGSYITIITDKKSTANSIKRYLIRHGVPKQDIKIMQKNIQNTRLILTGRK
jgi:hypothetical protein